MIGLKGAHAAQVAGGVSEAGNNRPGANRRTSIKKATTTETRLSWVKIYLDPATQLTEQEASQFAESRYKEVPYSKWPVAWEAITSPRKQPWKRSEEYERRI
jgi:hypothetical protein